MTDTPFTAVQTEALDPAACEIERAIIESAGARDRAARREPGGARWC